MTGGIRRLPAVALVAMVLACESAPAPAVSPSTAALGGQLVDVLTYKVDNARTGVMPGPALVEEPEILWEVALEAGSPASPLVHDGEVIIAPRDGPVRALEAETGRETWSLQLDAGIAWTPTIADGTLYVVTDDGVLHGIQLEDRSVAWTAEGFLDETIVTVVDGLVLAGAPGELVALSVDGKERWRQDAGGSDRVATDGTVAYVGGEGSGTLTALAVDGGAEQWQLDLDTARVLTPTIVEDGLVVAGRDNVGGHNLVVGLAADGTQQWRWEPAGRGSLGAFAVAEDRVIVASHVEETAVQAIDVHTGDELWTTSIPGDGQMIPVVAGQTLYIGGSGLGITALDTTTGAIRWALPFDGVVGGGMAVTGGLLIAATQRGRWWRPRRRPGGCGRPASRRTRFGASDEPTARHARAVAATRGTQCRRHPGRVPAARSGRGAGRDDVCRRHVEQPGRHQASGRRDRVLGEEGAGPGEFDFAPVTENDSSTSIAVSPDGELIVVADGNNHRVQVFDGSRRHLRSIGRLGRDDRQFVNPCCVAVDPEHRIWVVDTAQAEVQVFDADGTHLRTFGSPGSGEGQLSRPGIPFVDLANDEVYIPDFGNRRISVFSTDGTWLRHYDWKLNDELRFDEMNLVVVDRAGRLFVVDTTNRLFVLDRDGTLLHTFSGTAPGAGDIEFGPFVLQDDGRIYLTDISGTTEARLIIGQLGAPVWPPPTE